MKLSVIDIAFDKDGGPIRESIQYSVWTQSWQRVGENTVGYCVPTPRWLVNAKIFTVMQNRINFQIKNPIKDETFRN